LILEAVDLGLRPAGTTTAEWEESVALLKDISSGPLPDEESEIAEEGDEYERLQESRLQLTHDLRRTKDQLLAVLFFTPLQVSMSLANYQLM
jgi:hypothetical protein